MDSIRYSFDSYQENPAALSGILEIIIGVYPQQSYIYPFLPHNGLED